MKVRVSLLVAVLFLLVAPNAFAATYTVDSTADEADVLPGTGGCLTAGAKCTLRAALEESNFSTGTRDEIKFAAAFDGQPADTIALGSSLPAITDPVSVLGGDCFGEDGPHSPCAGVDGPSGGSALIVDNANGVVIEGLSVTEAQTAINVIDSSEEFSARNDWIGIKLGGTEGGNTTGIFLDPDSDKAVIGGVEPQQRNLFGYNAGDGLDILGADEAEVLGNYFGAVPDESAIDLGGTTAAANGTDIEITDSTSGGGFTAENNEIGSTIEGSALTSDACDGGCNVVSGATGNGIDLNGSGGQEKPASGPTTIHGNFVGLNAAGTGTIANAGVGIWAGGAQHVTVGGVEAGDANYVAGGSEGIVSESGGEDFNALGNQIGFGSDGSEQTPPVEKGILALALSVNEDPEIENNAVRMAGGVGIESRFLTGRIIGNEVEGGGVGIRTVVGSGAGLIASNTVTAPTEAGILVENPDNDVRGNSVSDSGDAGIKVRNPPGVAMTGNTIGGGSKGEENVLESNGGPAIEVLEEALEPGSATEMTRNRGSLNGGPFITLLNGANGGIAPPTAATATSTSAGGTATPNATMRVFSKAESAAGELKGFLAETEADGSGNWKVTFPAVAGGTLVTATQTVAGATSQLATPVAVPSESSGGRGGGKDDKAKDDQGKAKGKDKGGKDDNSAGAPQTTIRKVKVSGTKATFKFTSSTKGAKFECKLDKQKFKPCKSPKTYKKLKPGKHIFKVRAVKDQKVDPTPAKRKFKIVTT